MIHPTPDINDFDYWASDEDHPVEDWKQLVAENNTRMGYWAWVESQREMHQCSL